jgi:hypothetical protein
MGKLETAGESTNTPALKDRHFSAHHLLPPLVFFMLGQAGSGPALMGFLRWARLVLAQP